MGWRCLYGGSWREALRTLASGHTTMGVDTMSRPVGQGLGQGQGWPLPLLRVPGCSACSPSSTMGPGTVGPLCGAGPTLGSSFSGATWYLGKQLGVA